MSTWLRCRPRHTTVCLRPPPCPALIGIVSFYPSIYLDCYKLSLQDIAEKVGYLSRAKFADAFNNYYGVTPFNYRCNVNIEKAESNSEEG